MSAYRTMTSARNAYFRFRPDREPFVPAILGERGMDMKKSVTAVHDGVDSQGSTESDNATCSKRSPASAFPDSYAI